MQSSRIYTDFNPEIAWIRREVEGLVGSLDPSVQPRARFYTEVRLKVIPGRGVTWQIDQGMGRMLPYVAFWLADALGLANMRLRRLGGLSLVLSAITTALRDDIADVDSANNPEMVRLEQCWAGSYAETMRELFPAEHQFRKVMLSAEAECKRYERWQSTPLPNAHPRPFSAGFLRESSRATVACILPPLIAIAYAARREEDIPRIRRFLWEYSMGWRISDDLMDWEEDIVAKEMNRSSVLVYVGDWVGRARTVDRFDVLSCFLSDRFAEDAYGTIIGYMSKARKIVSGFGSPYLDQFMEEEIGFQTHKRDLLIRSGKLTLSDLNEGLARVLGPVKRRALPPKRRSQG